MASTPGFDPNLIEQTTGYAKVEATKSPCPPEPASPLLNRATQGLYPPGSTFKTITAAAALDDGVYTPDSTFYDPGYCTEYGKQVHNALDQSGPEAFGLVNLVEAYQHSINAVFCNIGQKLGAAADPRRGEEVRLLLGAAARDAGGRALGLGPLPERQALRPEDGGAVLAGRPGPARLRPGPDARDAAPDGARRRGRRRQRRPDDADADPADRRAGRVGDRQPEAAGPAPGDLAEDRGAS